MSEIKILHLSDIHFRKKKSKNKDDDNKLSRQDVQQKLIDTVSSHLKENTPPGVVAVTGDIAFSGKKPEYDDALEFFEKLKSILPKETEFLAVPGNHDVDRDEVEKNGAKQGFGDLVPGKVLSRNRVIVVFNLLNHNHFFQKIILSFLPIYLPGKFPQIKQLHYHPNIYICRVFHHLYNFLL
jgi:predicted MPP superfamily phosphohydrolase